VKPVRFVHVVYRTRRFKELLRWYETVFDAKVQDPALAFLTNDVEHHRFAFANLEVLQPNGPRTDAVGVDHVAYTYTSLGDLLENYRQLKAAASYHTGASITASRCRCITPILTATRRSSRSTPSPRPTRPTPSCTATASA
jgi:catechol-2,3-dioxygenase